MKYGYKTLPEIGDIGEKRVLVRLDLNVPIRAGEVLDDFRIKRVLPTLELLKSKGAKIILISHIESESNTLQPVFGALQSFFPLKALVKGFGGTAVPTEISTLLSGEAVLCENIRLYAGERTNDKGFSAMLASRADIYVNEAFSVSHRPHASIIGVPKIIPGYAGLLFDTEVRQLAQAFNPARPALLILGGAKFETKLPLLKKFLKLYDRVFVGGALANDIFKMRGTNVGVSRVSGNTELLRELLMSKNLRTPLDVVVQNKGERLVKRPEEVLPLDSILDAGPKTLEMLEEFIQESQFVLWNGPLGNYELGFRQSTERLATCIAKNAVHSIIGGGDTLAVVSALGIFDKFDFVSSAGGAMLEFLATETLPGIEALCT